MSASSAAILGDGQGILSAGQVRQFVRRQLDGQDVDGRSVVVLVPDGTRSCPLPALLDAVHQALAPRVARMTVLIALGTHAPMSEEEIARLLQLPEGGLAERYPGMTVQNHEWWDPETFVSLGAIGPARVNELSGGMLDVAVDVRVNRAVVENDVTLILGPVFPHEVVGFSGGAKYLFPGVAGQEVIDLSHWLGALITSAEMIGSPGVTPVRALIHDAAALVPSRQYALSVVVQSGTGALHAVAFGSPEESWAAAAEVSALVHVRYLDRPVRRVLSLMPDRYDDMWTAAKGMYKVEPAVADGGEVVIYAPHVTDFSRVHKEITEIGFHCRDFFLKQWDRYRHHHWGVLAHSTHLRGQGTYDEQAGEHCRITVTLATGISEEATRAAGLEYLDPATLDVAGWQADPDTLVVPQAGEVLFRVRPRA
ncbi:lactate racemase domain-containing protein [Motilibacter aurantiacus]|uniref:lactate racemase domain-containing protein n=1 Tax=Motilibacter aurantiacus TaxID=2714955 RepID=UPI0014080759|nr:lactate racemase domain-containing protein [Motilibacter aurantiacus]NHC46717.1 DUF2088 domain-containing protein [Motilibacter aurantiacus]